jgi:hypothetical protein
MFCQNDSVALSLAAGGEDALAPYSIWVGGEKVLVEPRKIAARRAHEPVFPNGHDLR